MNNSSPKAGACLLLSLCICLPSFGQQHNALSRTGQERQTLKQAPALTYNAHKYLQAEQLIEETLSRGPIQTLEQLLSDNFTARSASSSFDKSEWLRPASPRSRKPWTIRELNVQVQDDLSIVSFLRVNPQQPSQQQFIVDIWRDSTQKLLNRFESPVGKQAADQPVRPDGKG
jgi:hypothetical protein